MAKKARLMQHLFPSTWVLMHCIPVQGFTVFDWIISFYFTLKCNCNFYWLKLQLFYVKMKPAKQHFFIGTKNQQTGNNI